jgi:hypothetical protein
MTTSALLNARSPAMPRGAGIAADLFTRFIAWMSSPVAPRVRTRGEEAARVRELACSVQNTDPGFAADLFGAAARHEMLDDLS